MLEGAYRHLVRMVSTINWGAVVSAPYPQPHLLGGADLEVSLTQQQMNGTNAAQSFAHGLTGGAPNWVLFFSICDATLPRRQLSLEFDEHWSVGGKYTIQCQYFQSRVANDHVDSQAIGFNCVSFDYYHKRGPVNGSRNC